MVFLSFYRICNDYLSNKAWPTKCSIGAIGDDFVCQWFDDLVCSRPEKWNGLPENRPQGVVASEKCFRLHDENEMQSFFVFRINMIFFK